MSQIATPSLAPATPAPEPTTAPTTPAAPAPPAQPSASAAPVVAAAPAAPAAPVASDATALSLAPSAVPQADIDVRSIFQRANIDPKKIADEYRAGGQVSDETVRLIKAADPNLKYLSKDLINQFVRGQAAVHEQEVHRVEVARTGAITAAGGEQQLETLKAWAAQNVDPSRMARFETMIKNDPSVYPDIVKLLAAEHREKSGAAGSNPLVPGQTTTSVGSKPKTNGELAAINTRALMGDAAAIAIVNSLTPADYASIK